MTKTRDEIVAAMKAQLDETNAMLGDLETRAAKATAEALEKYRQQIARLQEQSESAQEKLKELTDAGEDAWEGMVAEAEKLRDAFIHSFNYFKSQL
jgi:chromosome segregation ATPase